MRRSGWSTVSPSAGRAVSGGDMKIRVWDLETGDVVAQADAKSQTYGPVFVPYHDFRVLYAECEGGK